MGTVQDYVEQGVVLTIDQQEHVDLQFSSFELSLSMDDWARRVGKPSGIVLANVVDAFGCGLYWQVPNAILSPTTGTDKWLAYLQAGAILADNATPQDGEWHAILNQWEQAAVINGNESVADAQAAAKVVTTRIPAAAKVEGALSSVKSLSATSFTRSIRPRLPDGRLGNCGH